MDLGSLFLVLALLVLVSLFVSRPFFENKAVRKGVPVSQEEHELSALLAERDRLLTALQELDFDYTLGKIPEEDYPPQRTALLKRGAETLRLIDQMSQEGAAGGSAEDRIEAIIAARRADARSAGAVNGHGRVVAAALAGEADDPVEVLLANRRRQRQEKSAGFCPQCGGPVQKSDRFCPKCGKPLQ